MPEAIGISAPFPGLCVGALPTGDLFAASFGGVWVAASQAKLEEVDRKDV